MRTIGYLVWKEYLQIVRDRATLFQILMIPMIQLVVLSFAATFEITESEMFLVDQDRTEFSRGLVREMEGSGYFQVVGSSANGAEGDRALMEGEASMVLTIPAGFERALVRGEAAPAQIILNAEQGAAAGIVRSYAVEIMDRYSRRVTTEGVGGPAGPGQAGRQRIEVSRRSWFNPTRNYLDYMVPGILVALVTVIGTLLAAQNIAREKELGTLEQLNVTPLTRTQFIAGKLVPFWILGMGELAGGLALAAFVFQIPFRGSIALVFAIAAIYLCAALGLGLLISTVAETQQQAMFVTFFVLMIYLLMSGLYTPVSSMPDWVQAVAEINPGKHFVHVMRAVFVKGAGAREMSSEAIALATFATVVLGAAVLRYSKRAA